MLCDQAKFQFNFVVSIFQDCLSVLSKYCNIDIKKTDRWRRSVADVATPICNQFLSQLGKNMLKLRHTFQ